MIVNISHNSHSIALEVTAVKRISTSVGLIYKISPD